MTNATHPFDALMDITARPQAVFVRGEGGYLWDDSGKRYLDFVQGWAVNCLGHSPPVVTEALAAQAKLLLTPSPAFYNAPSLKLAKALVDQRADGSQSGQEPIANCLPQGVPRVAAAPAPWKVIQTPGSIVILYEAANTWRQIFLDGRELSDDFVPAWWGYSTARWDGDTLVVDSRGFNGKAWMDQSGKPTSDALHVTERFRRKDFGHMDVQITLDDPKAYRKPWTAELHPELIPDMDLLEFICNENEKDVRHLVGI